jgi:hypothetical protein
MRLTARLVDVAKLTPPQREDMFALMVEHYANVHRHVFEADLAEKRWVILVRDPSTDLLRGFSSQTLLDAQVGGRPVKALFSGDTIIHRECWGDSALSHVWGQFALGLIDVHRGEELYWFLISQGYKTYRFLPLFFHEFYPRHDTPTPAWARAVVDALARSRYPKQYDVAAGVIRATAAQYRLRAGLAEVTAERLRDPHVRFFHTLNPGHVRGDELCCLAPLTRENFTRAAYRVIGPDKPVGQAFQPDCPARKPDLPLGVS